MSIRFMVIINEKRPLPCVAAIKKFLRSLSPFTTMARWRILAESLIMSWPVSRIYSCPYRRPQRL